MILPYPDPRLRYSSFVLRPFLERDFDDAVEFSQGSGHRTLGSTPAGGWPCLLSSNCSSSTGRMAS